MSEIDVARLRLIAQRLVSPRPVTASGVVEHLSALQAQDLPGAIRSVGLRMGPPDRSLASAEEAVRAALASGSVVRSWPMRGTLHLVPPPDLSWMLSLTRVRMESGAARRRDQLGIDEALYARARALAVAAIEQRGPLSRAELVDTWEPLGVSVVPGRAYHLIALLAMRAVVVQGPPHPTRPGEQLFALFDRWIPEPLRQGSEEAVAGWAAAYFRGHGPATVKDFARWTGLPLTTARRGLAAVQDELLGLTVDGQEHWLDPATPDLLASHGEEADAVLLLPGFDELLLGYADRSATLPTPWAERVVPGKNGLFRATVIHRGVAVGTWARGPGRNGHLRATPFEAFTAEQAAALTALGVTTGS